MTNLTIGNYVGTKRWNGFPCPNEMDDRITVASLLGGVPASQGGLQAGMTIDASMDGSIENALLAAIYRFQTEQKKKNGLQLVDGVIKPGGETMRFLNRFCVQPVPPTESRRMITKTKLFKISALVEIAWVWADPGNPRFSSGKSDTVFDAKLSLSVVTASGLKGVISLLGPNRSAFRNPSAKKLDRPMVLRLEPDFDISTDKNSNEDVAEINTEMEASDFASRSYNISVEVQGTGPVSVRLEIDGIKVVHHDRRNPDFTDRQARRRLVPIDDNPIMRVGFGKGWKPSPNNPSQIADLGLARLEWRGTLQKVAEF